MNLIQKLKIWKDLRRLEMRAREQPCPSTFVDLGQVYINLGLADKAMQTAEDGLALFPDSGELHKLRDFSRRSRARARVEELRSRINRSPNGKLYRELAGIHLELGDQQGLRTTCEEWSVRFPDDPGPWLLLAQARLCSYYRDLSAVEGMEAVTVLERVLTIDGTEKKARRLFAELLFRIGAVQKARAQLDRLDGGDDTELQALRQQVLVAPTRGSDLDALFRRVEEEGVLPNSLPKASGIVRLDDGIGALRAALAHVAEQRGVRKATYIKGARALVKGEIKDGKDSFLRVVRVIARSAQRFGRRLDIGHFNKGVVQGAFGNICICCYGEVVAAVECDATAQVDRVLADLQELVAGSLYSTGGVR